MSNTSKSIPVVGDIITENMGRYLVLGALGVSMFEVRSQASGVTLTIDFADSGYRDQRNAWRIVDAAVTP